LQLTALAMVNLLVNTPLCVNISHVGCLSSVVSIIVKLVIKMVH